MRDKSQRVFAIFRGKKKSFLPDGKDRSRDYFCAESMHEEAGGAGLKKCEKQLTRK